MKINEKTAKYYDRFARLYGDTYKSVNWSSRANQELRFHQFLKLFPQKDISLNDIGCGLGDFVTYFEKHSPYKLNYQGYDLSAEMIHLARKNYLSRPHINFDRIKTLNEVSVNEYSIASGTFNRRFLLPSKDHFVTYFYGGISRMAATSTKAFGFNFLSDARKPRFYDGLLYLNKNEVIRFCQSQFQCKVITLDDYHEVDVTLWCELQ